MRLFVKEQKMMGSAFKLGVICGSQKEADFLLEMGIQEISRIEDLLSEFKSNSLVSKINQSAGISTVKVPKEIYQLFKRCHQISKVTNGFFDISVGPLKKLYQFNNTNFVFPRRKEINKILNRVGFQKIKLDVSDQSIFLEKKNMFISFAAVGKGFAADKVKQLWKSQGLQSGFVNASGDLTAFGRNEDGLPWKIGISNPDNRNEMLFYVPIANSSIATSGDYEQFFIQDEVRYSHNINPKTGFPLQGIKSVTVFSPSAELSDALATAVYAMGIRKGVDFVNKLPKTEVIIIDDRNEVFFSENLVYEAA